MQKKASSEPFVIVLNGFMDDEQGTPSKGDECLEDVKTSCTAG